jgi:predicted  nucleic acid-binding Zn-ribbon protein
MTVDSLLKQKQKNTERKAQTEKKLLDLIGRLAGLRQARGDAGAADGNTDALDQEITGVQKDIDRCNDAIAAYDRANEKLQKEIETEAVAEKTERDDKAVAECQRYLSQAKRHYDPLFDAIISSAAAAVPVCFKSLGIFDYTKIDSLLSPLPAGMRDMFFGEMNRKMNQFISGEVPYPVKSEVANVVPVSRERKIADLQNELARAENLLDMAGFELAAERPNSANKTKPTNEFIAAEKKCSDARAEVERIKSELSKLEKGE